MRSIFDTMHHHYPTLETVLATRDQLLAKGMSNKDFNRWVGEVKRYWTNDAKRVAANKARWLRMTPEERDRKKWICDLVGADFKLADREAKLSQFQVIEGGKKRA